MGADLSKRLVSDELREPAAPSLPSFAARPQGGGTVPCDERAVFMAVVYDVKMPDVTVRSPKQVCAIRVRLQTDLAHSRNDARLTAASNEVAVLSYLVAIPRKPLSRLKQRSTMLRRR
ncbi:hypothetical protein GCM10010271_29780 [Streptomyces kurssanovii]|nr:hypothetical protein GCM10010271_29780 [Streptomyces kurssanovii]